MAYPQTPKYTDSPIEVEKFLKDISSRKEFQIYYQSNSKENENNWKGFLINPASLHIPGFRINGAQMFIRNFQNPDTDYTRILVNWQTGVGKSIAAISIAHEFIKQFRARAALGERAPMVFVISFTARETIQEDMLKYPEFGFVSTAEVEELRYIRMAAFAAGPASTEAKQLSGLIGALRRRITDKTRGGYYQFYGYKEFANRLFRITKQGIENNFDVQSLYAHSDKPFGESLMAAVKKGDIIIDEDLLEEMKGGLLICDEIHNVYNILEKNNYGIAIQYVLDSLGDDAPRAVFMSATPVTGSAAEVVDLLNLLVPRNSLPGGMPLKRSDFFIKTSIHSSKDEEASTFVVSQFREGALDKLARLAAGRVSFLLDSDVGSYPRRIFVGEDMPGVPYLKITPCPMPKFHEQTLIKEQSDKDKSDTSGLAANAYTLYDMVFPNPDFPPDAANSNKTGTYGLYKSNDTLIKLASASPEWLSAAKVILEKSSDSGSPNALLITGAFLQLKNLYAYSSKIARIVEYTIEAVKNGSGKIMIYHHRVKMSGVRLIQEALRMNGFADEYSSPTDNTLCSVCGINREHHSDKKKSEEHPFMPARFIVAHSGIDRAVMIRSISKYNSSANVNGYQFRVIVGSRIIREGLNFRAVRYLNIASFTNDYPTLLQVTGRTVRKESHSELPYEDRDVNIRIFVTTRTDGRTTPELQRYIDKGKEYLVIQEIERVFRICAVDAFANFDRIKVALSPQGGYTQPSLDSLPYTPKVLKTTDKVNVSTFYAYGHSGREVSIIASVCRVLFAARPVWTYEDLWEAVKSGSVKGVSYNAASFDENNFALALQNLSKPAGDPPKAIIKAGRFYVTSLMSADGRLLCDIESYMRDDKKDVQSTSAKISVSIGQYIKGWKSEKNFSIRLLEFEKLYLLPDSPSTVELSLVEYGASFHFSLLRQLISSNKTITVDDDRIRELYRRFRIAITIADTTTAEASRSIRGVIKGKPDDIIGYVNQSSVTLYNMTDHKWYNASHADFAISRRHKENDILIGYVVSTATTLSDDDFAADGTAARFKIRLPMSKLRAEASTKTAAENKKNDIRSLARGAVCTTRSREDLNIFVRRLRTIVARTGVTVSGPIDDEKIGGSIKVLTAKLDYAVKYDKSTRQRFPSANELCHAIRLYLLALEEYARAPANGMTEGIRWLYLFNDVPPTMTLSP